MMFLRWFPLLPAVALAASPLQAQTPTPAGPRNLIGNGGFETSFRRENLWDGVDAAGYLAGERGALPVLTTAGSIAESAMPLSVSVADVNNDGRPDLITMDVLGYCRVYFNTAEPGQPAKFEMGDLANFFLSRVAPNDPVAQGAPNRAILRRGGRLHATTMFRTGKVDLIIGNYVGEVMAVFNGGSVQIPDFRQPQDVSRAVIPTSKDPRRLWGNVFSPAVWDWNRDGRDDLILGEGSYSANNIHLLINTGGGTRPVFEEENRHVLAYGDGLEQLSPAVVDYNGDGLPDLLVSERSGKVALYLNKGAQWRSGEPLPELPFASFVNTAQGSPLTFGGICTIAVADLSGNGLFDIVAGKSNGRIAVAYNKGTKQEPKFDPPVELKGTPDTPPMNLPSGWEVDYGLERGNFLAYCNVVRVADDPNLQPAEGQGAVKFGYQPSHNRLMPAPSFYSPGFGNFNPEGGSLLDAPARAFRLRQAGRFRFNNGATYTFSMKSRGRASDAVVVIRYVGEREVAPERIQRGDRDAVVRQRQVTREEKTETIRFSPGSSWTTTSRDFRVSFSNRDLNPNDLKQTNTAEISITFTLPPGAELFLDDISIIEKTQG